jgi:hypothetical protein
MSKPKVLYKWAYFVPQSTGSQQDGPIPTVNDTHKLGTVLTVSGAREYEEAIFDTPKGGKWVDRGAINQRDREVLSITLSELTPLYHSLVEAAGPGVAAGSNVTLTPGSQVTYYGWLILTTHTDAAMTTQSYSARWVKMDLPSWDLPQTGYAQQTLTARILDSTAQTAQYLNNY